MSTFQKLKDLIASAEADAIKFHEKNNGAAGTRLRKIYQEIKLLAQAGRAEVTELKNKEAK
ncbi:histone H1 [Pedobacter sp. GSP4]|uniref:histone H1 n=1 Tax=Pedobacter sp. GSP4 TaxID=3453716 RepID=UPI003EE8A371